MKPKINSMRCFHDIKFPKFYHNHHLKWAYCEICDIQINVNWDKCILFDENNV